MTYVKTHHTSGGTRAAAPIYLEEKPHAQCHDICKGSTGSRPYLEVLERLNALEALHAQEDGLAVLPLLLGPPAGRAEQRV